MKKRAKIITTIASLCLAVALMAFGVYAATTATLSVTSQIAFSVEDVFVSVWGTARLVANSGNPEDDTPLTSYETEQAPAKSYTVANDGTTAAIDGGEATTPLDPWTILNGQNAPAYDVNHGQVEYVLHITNDSSEAVYVSLSSSILPYIEGTTVAAQYQIDNAAAVTGLAAESTSGEPAVTTNTVTMSGVSLAGGSTMVITLTRTLVDYSTTFALTNSLSGSVTMAHTNPNA